MYNIKDYLVGLERFAPLYLSHKMIEKGHYDNSGIIVANHDDVKKVLYTLDLSLESVNYAIKQGCDTVVTHHPAIYAPIKQMEFDGENKALLSAIKNNLNVISMHLNLDVAEKGIDYQLALSTGGRLLGNIDVVEDNCGYGKSVEIDLQDLKTFTEKLKTTLKTDKVIVYGDGKVNKVATFCGAGASDAVCVAKQDKFAVDTVVTSDIAHHNLLELIERNKNVVIIPHYVAENFGFEKFYEYARENLRGAEAYYFTDKRFM